MQTTNGYRLLIQATDRYRLQTDTDDRAQIQTTDRYRLQTADTDYRFRLKTQL